MSSPRPCVFPVFLVRSPRLHGSSSAFTLLSSFLGFSSLPFSCQLHVACLFVDLYFVFWDFGFLFLLSCLPKATRAEWLQRHKWQKIWDWKWNYLFNWIIKKKCFKHATQVFLSAIWISLEPVLHIPHLALPSAPLLADSFVILEEHRYFYNHTLTPESLFHYKAALRSSILWTNWGITLLTANICPCFLISHLLQL